MVEVTAAVLKAYKRLMSLIRFNVFGRILAVRRDRDSWRVYSVDMDGKLGQTES
jgi:hypothetical protein